MSQSHIHDRLAGAPSSGGPRATTVSRARFATIYTTLRDRICLLDYAPGTILAEAEIAAEFGVSRTPVRSVLARLESEGLVARRHGVGTMVTDVDIEGLRQVYDLRIELAALMGKLAPLRCGPGDLDALRRCRERCKGLRDAPDPSAFARLNMDFHTLLHGMVASAPLRDIIERLYFQTTRIWLKSVPRMTLSAEVDIFMRQIVDIIEALAVDDHVSVGDICRIHISMSFRRLASYAGETA